MKSPTKLTEAELDRILNRSDDPHRPEPTVPLSWFIMALIAFISTLICLSIAWSGWNSAMASMKQQDMELVALHSEHWKATNHVTITHQ